MKHPVELGLFSELRKGDGNYLKAERGYLYASKTFGKICTVWKLRKITHTLFWENFVKITFLLKKLLKS